MKVQGEHYKALVCGRCGQARGSLPSHTLTVRGQSILVCTPRRYVVVVVRPVPGNLPAFAHVLKRTDNLAVAHTEARRYRELLASMHQTPPGGKTAVVVDMETGDEVADSP